MAETGFCRQKTNPVSTSQLYCSSMDLEFHWPFYRVIFTVRCYACLLINVVIWYCWCRRTSQIDELNTESVTGMLGFCCLMILCLYYAFDHATSCHYAQHTHTGTHAIFMAIFQVNPCQPVPECQTMLYVDDASGRWKPEIQKNTLHRG